MDVPTWVWWTTIIVTMSVLLFDVVVIGRRPHEPSMKEVSVALAVYVGLAVAFGIAVWVLSGHDFGVQFFAGWLTEYSLSIDNLFIFIIIMAKFGVPRKYQQEALMVGIVLALVMRGIFIGVGAAAINQFSWIFYLFGAFLVYTAVKLAKEGSNEDSEYEENRLLTWVENHLPATEEWNGVKIFARENGKRVVTPMFIVILALGTVRREARAAGRRASHHLAHLVVHGALHLRGHDHALPGEARRMEMAETRLLRRMGVPDPWRTARRPP